MYLFCVARRVNSDYFPMKLFFPSSSSSSFVSWRYNPLWVCILRPSSGAVASWPTRFLDHIQRRATVGRTPQSVADTSTWQHTTLTTGKHPCPRWIRTHDFSRRAAVDLRLRPRGHWDRLCNIYWLIFIPDIECVCRAARIEPSQYNSG